MTIDNKILVKKMETRRKQFPYLSGDDISKYDAVTLIGQIDYYPLQIEINDNRNNRKDAWEEMCNKVFVNEKGYWM